MSLRRTPNPNRNHPVFCPYCAGEELFPDIEDDFAWSCQDCTRVFSVRYHGQDDPHTRPAPAPSTSQALHVSLSRHGIDLSDRRERAGQTAVSHIAEGGAL